MEFANFTENLQVIVACRNRSEMSIGTPALRGLQEANVLRPLAAAPPDLSTGENPT